MKVLTSDQMGDVDRRTIDSGIPFAQLMENAAARVVEFIAERFMPLSDQDIVVVCGKGNNGGDGLAVARQLREQFAPRSVRVMSASETLESPPATIVVDAVLGTGLKGPAQGPALAAIRHINSAFSGAKVIAVDIPSGLSGDSGAVHGAYVRADATVTFTALKICHAMPPACHLMGELHPAQVGTPPRFCEEDPRFQLSLITAEQIAPVFAPRPRDSHKGTFGHVLLIAGSPGRSGAAAMAGLAALRSGAGLVTVDCPESVQALVAGFAPELMTAQFADWNRFSLAAIGPGLGTDPSAHERVHRLFSEFPGTAIVDADALNCLAGAEWRGKNALRILTPHPGEMSRLTGLSVSEIQADRIVAVRNLASERNVIVVLKGERTLIGFPDGRVWINPTGSPAMATGGTGDILTGMISGLLAQFPHDPERALAAAVYLHGLAGEIAARHLTEQCVIATDLLKYLPEGIREITNCHLPV